MKKKTAVIWGSSGHAKVVADIVRLQKRFQITAFVDDRPAGQRPKTFLGKPVFSRNDIFPLLKRKHIRHIFLGFGDCKERLRLAELLRRSGFVLAQAVHPSSVVAADVALGEGVVIAAGAVVNPGVQLGLAAIVNTAATVDHDCVIGAGAHICPGAHLAGGVLVGQVAMIGIGAVVKQNIIIGNQAVVGAGSAVIKNVKTGSVVAGCPARPIKQRRL